ncbi:hypothetical protein [Pseudoalteromonas spongiae]|uniref:hypothetical protein n=1 Tax=Pseudoalteromonas spongiae TaxID=298657 RepID=UPI00373595C1
MKYLIVFCLLISSGCSSIIANKITQSEDIQGNINLSAKEVDVCGNTNNCTKVYQADGYSHTMVFNLDFGSSKQTWLYQSKFAEKIEEKPLQGEVVYVFAGYSQPFKLLTQFQDWLTQVTGAQVFIVPSANNESTFRFGMSYVEPIVQYIRKENKNVHLIGFSMGAIPAQQIAMQIENSSLHLIAPMTNFETSLNAFREYYLSSVDRYFVGQEEVKEAADIVIERAELKGDELDIIGNLRESHNKAFVYISPEDVVVADNRWNEFDHPNVHVYSYSNMMHEVIVMLMNQQLKFDLISNLTSEEYISKNNKFLGTICEAKDRGCINNYTQFETELSE